MRLGHVFGQGYEGGSSRGGMYAIPPALVHELPGRVIRNRTSRTSPTKA